jgi:indole-3-glycerol phosphate synthase
MARFLDEIVAWHRARAAADERDRAALANRAAATLDSDPTRDFAAALCAAPGIGVIAEVKRRSPSKGDLVPRLDPAAIARDYEAGGAAALSVLTDERYFGGSAEDLVAARAAVGLPVLRKDFTVAPADVDDARLMGADAVLLIVAALSDAELRGLIERAGELSMTALVEVHDEKEAERARVAGARVVGVNQRDLRTFEVDSERAVRVARALGPDVVRVAESGISSPADLSVLAEAGFDAVLVGEAFVRAPDRIAAVRAMAAPAAAAAR